MKLKRMAVVVAAAVVSPAVLAVTPATAQEKPAATVPDAAPKDNPAGTDEAESPETGTPVTETPVIEKPAPPVPTAPAAEQPTSKPAPASSTRGFHEGPAVSAQGIPDSFEPGGSAAQFTVTVDNSGGAPVSDYVPAVGISGYDDRLEPSHITAEVRGTDGTWKPVELRLDRGPTVYEIELGSSAVDRDEVFSTDVRLSFSEDAPQVRFEIYVLGQGTDAAGEVLSAATWYDAVIGSGEDSGEEDGGGEEDPVYVDGPALTLDGVPSAGFKAGAGWHEMTLRIDNTGIGDIEEYIIGLNVGRGLGQGDWLKSSQIKVEAYGLDENDAEGWYPLDVEGSEEMYGMTVGALPIAADEKVGIQLRMRFTSDTAAGPVNLSTLGWAAEENEAGEYMSSETHTYRTTILAADAGSGDDEGGDANEPAPQGGVQPIADNGSGSGTGGQLAETGTDAATSWALGGAGLAVAMGAALAAGTGRHRRPSAL